MLFCPKFYPLVRPKSQKLRHVLDDFASEYNVLPPPLFLDETLGIGNIDVRRYADALVNSLTKVVSGEGDVMGGAVTPLRHSVHYSWLKETLARQENLLHHADAAVLLKNAKGFEKRLKRMNENAVKLAAYLRSRTDVVDQVNFCDKDPAFEKIRKPDGGYGGLVSFTLKKPELLAVFYDALDLAKGPSLGISETLIMLYTLLAHFGSLGKVKDKAGVEAHLIRVSVGVESFQKIKARFNSAFRQLKNPSPHAPSVIFHPDRAEIKYG